MKLGNYKDSLGNVQVTGSTGGWGLKTGVVMKMGYV